MNIFETIILITMASLGFRCITDKGMIFYFLRKPVDNWKKIVENMKDLTKKEDVFFRRCFQVLIYCMKPIILCGTCMSSVHTLIWWPILQGEYNAFTIVTMLSVAFLNTFLYLIIEKLQGK